MSISQKDKTLLLVQYLVILSELVFVFDEQSSKRSFDHLRFANVNGGLNCWMAIKTIPSTSTSKALKSIRDRIRFGMHAGKCYRHLFEFFRLNSCLRCISNKYFFNYFKIYLLT